MSTPCLLARGPAQAERGSVERTPGFALLGHRRRGAAAGFYATASPTSRLREIASRICDLVALLSAFRTPELSCRRLARVARRVRVFAFPTAAPLLGASSAAYSAAPRSALTDRPRAADSPPDLRVTLAPDRLHAAPLLDDACESIRSAFISQPARGRHGLLQQACPAPP